jgi:hypothetical protein
MFLHRVYFGSYLGPVEIAVEYDQIMRMSRDSSKPCHVHVPFSFELFSNDYKIMQAYRYTISLFLTTLIFSQADKSRDLFFTIFLKLIFVHVFHIQNIQKPFVY